MFSTQTPKIHFILVLRQKSFNSTNEENGHCKTKTMAHVCVETTVEPKSPCARRKKLQIQLYDGCRDLVDLWALQRSQGRWLSASHKTTSKIRRAMKTERISSSHFKVLSGCNKNNRRPHLHTERLCIPRSMHQSVKQMLSL